MKTENPRSIHDRALHAGYALSLVASISVWLIAVRSPLGLDETGAFWQISAGVSKIWSRQGLYFPGYAYILWLTTKVLGRGELALRLPSILAMLGAAYLLYLVARELFDHDLAMIALVVFCIDPIVIFQSISVRPYAFAALMVNAAILVLLRLRHNDSNRMAALFGFLSASILYFHYLIGAVLPALAIGFFLVKRGDRAVMRRQLAIALGTFALAFLPVIPGLEYIFRTRASHVYEQAPGLGALIWTLAPRFSLIGLVITALAAVLAAGMGKHWRDRDRLHLESWRVWFCLSLALVPLLILYGVSVGTPLHVFVRHYRLAAVPGIALCWAMLVGSFDSRAMRLVFCLAVALATAHADFASPGTREHGYTWKYAVEVAERNAAPTDAPVLICSDFIESNHAAMPLRSAKESPFFAPLSYYKLSVPVVPLPKALNAEAIRIASPFLQQAARRRETFLALANTPSYRTLDWIAKRASATDRVHELGIFDGVKVLKFTPRTVTPNRQRVPGARPAIQPSPKRAASAAP